MAFPVSPSLFADCPHIQSSLLPERFLKPVFYPINPVPHKSRRKDGSDTMKTPLNEMTLTFLSRSANEAFARAAAASFLVQLDPTVEELSDVRTAVSEAVTNCIVHAYKDAIGKITLTLRIWEGRRITVKIRDTGCGIPNVKQAMEPLFTTAPSEERSGLGFAVMQVFMDRVTVRSTPGKGTIVTLEKTLSARGNSHGPAE